MSEFWKEYPLIEEELKQVLTLVNQSSKSSETYLNKSLDYLLMAGGKMVRPAFVLLGSRFGNYSEDNKEKIIHLAASIETLHMATLIHDDIIDESKLRRGQDSIQSKYGKPYAVYMGDYLFTQCFIMLVDYDFEKENIKRLSEAMKRICIGEMMQYQRRYKIDKSTKNYLKVISGKTAALLAISLGVGAYESGAPEDVSKCLGRIGYNVGMAFQIIDDLLDYNGNSKNFGKDTKADILKGYYTLPIIRSFGKTQGTHVEAILKKPNLSEKDISHLIALTKSSGALDESKKLAEKYSQRAMDHLATLPDCEAKSILNEVIPKLLNRSK